MCKDAESWKAQGPYPSDRLPAPRAYPLLTSKALQVYNKALFSSLKLCGLYYSRKANESRSFYNQFQFPDEETMAHRG